MGSMESGGVVVVKLLKKEVLSVIKPSKNKTSSPSERELSIIGGDQIEVACPFLTASNKGMLPQHEGQK